MFINLLWCLSTGLAGCVSARESMIILVIIIIAITLILVVHTKSSPLHPGERSLFRIDTSLCRIAAHL